MRFIIAATLLLAALPACGMDTLRSRYPWPQVKPAVPLDPQSMFSNPLQMRAVLKPSMKLIVELGSWLGGSTRFIMDHAPQAMVVAIDHWRGSPEHQHNEWAYKLPTLYETFLVNCWGYKDRLIPMRTTTLFGLREIYDLGLVPDLIYVDAGHEYESVMADLVTIHMLFPETHVIGDDWGWPSVRQAVIDFANKNNLSLFAYDNFWDMRPFQKMVHEYEAPYDSCR